MAKAAKKAAPKKGAQKDMTGRNEKGQFVKGYKGGGRAKLPPEIKEMCQALTPKAIETAKRIMLDEEQKASDRLRAVEIILDRGYGKPVQAVDLDTNNIPQVIFVGGDDIAD